MSRRSSRRAPKKAAYLPAGVTTGLESLVEGNESIIASMLSVDIKSLPSPDARTKLIASLTDCMAMNDFSAEALLARFFDVSVLRTYCERRLGVSSKGNAATLAARVARAWSKPTFGPLPLEEEGGDCNEKKKSSTKEGSTKKRTKKEDESEKGSDCTDKKKSSTKEESTKKRTEKEDESVKKKKKQKMWTVNQKPSFTVTAPPGPLGLTIKQYSDDFIVTDVSQSCAIPEAENPFPKVRPGSIITTIDGMKIKSENDAILKDCDKSRVLTVAGGVISNNAAEHSKGTLLHMKEAGFAMFRLMDYSDVAEKYGEEFLKELSPPNKGKSGKQILAGALASLGKA
ncbi:hypothetical protein ACHAXR_008073 [Thalassiosira sp. AJA248-18]